MRQAMGTGDGGGGDNATGCVSSRRLHLRGVLWMAGQATGSSDGGSGNNAMGGTGKRRQNDAFSEYFIRRQGKIIMMLVKHCCTSIFSANRIKELTRGEQNHKKRIVYIILLAFC
jgi:hypothetical protein